MANVSITLNARENGTQTMPDGTRVTIWGFSTNSMGGFSVPGPKLVFNEGDNVTLTLNNMTMHDHTIHLHGLDVDTANDGVAETSQAVPPMGSFTYRFAAPHAGTYIYHCHVHAVLHMQMGMYGALVIKPPDGSNRAWAGGPAYDLEATWVLSEFDTAWHSNPDGVNLSQYNPNYYLINGRANPDPSSDPNTQISAKVGQTVLLRLINMGYLINRVSLGGISFQVIASDGRPLPSPQTATEWTIAPGERYDLLFTLTTPGTWTATVNYLNWYQQDARGTANTTITAS